MVGEEPLFDAARRTAMVGLRTATSRVDEALTEAATPDGPEDLEQLIVQTLWWQKSIEDLWEEQAGQSYYRRRDAAPGGAAIGGLAYLRNVGGHRPDRSYDEVVYRAASTVESVVLALGLARRDRAADGELCWPRLTDLPEIPMADPFGRHEMYSDQIAARPLLVPLRAALGFFEALGAE